MMLLPFYRSAVRQFDTRVQAVRPEQWSISTPDEGWDVHRLVRHVIAGQLLVPELLDGDALPAGSYVHDAAGLSGEELVHAWSKAAAAAVDALTRQDSLEKTISLPGGDSSAEDYGWRLVTELTVHAWDLARAIGAPDEFPNDLLANVLEHSKPSADQWLSPKQYAPSIPVPGCTDDLTELLALTGRNRWWRRS
jgi:uncharacterized protein (TIGR03086 family)